MQRSILLVEPGYKSKYPPLGLMKISQYHKSKGDNVQFVKGLNKEKAEKKWHRIYIASLFTYHWKETIQAIEYYRHSVVNPVSENLVVGGVMATLMAKEIRELYDCRVIEGLLDQRGKMGYKDDETIDDILPDYSILEEADYTYSVTNAYFAYTTRGCIRTCSFCAVHRIEPEFKEYISITQQVEDINRRYKPKRDLILLDNNVLASDSFERIISDIKKAGFYKGARFKQKCGDSTRETEVSRRVDFNQGIDIRLLDDEKMALLSEIAINPLRLAFDNYKDKDLYEEKVRLAAQYGIRHLSNYILFNYNDTPEELYKRLLLNVTLNQELGLQIFSFPMRYADLHSKDRLTTTPGNVGPYWNRKYLRALQCILICTRGIVSHRLDFFQRAFGANEEEFKKILLMPEDYIINRVAREKDGSTADWWRMYESMNREDAAMFLHILLNHRFKKINTDALPCCIAELFAHYKSTASRSKDAKRR